MPLKLKERYQKYKETQEEKERKRIDDETQKYLMRAKKEDERATRLEKLRSAKEALEKQKARTVKATESKPKPLKVTTKKSPGIMQRVDRFLGIESDKPKRKRKTKTTKKRSAVVYVTPSKGRKIYSHVKINSRSKRKG